MYSASIPIIGLHHGASRNGLSAPPRRSQRRSDDLTGGVCRPVPEPKDRDCTTGATSNSRALEDELAALVDETGALHWKGLGCRCEVGFLP